MLQLQYLKEGSVIAMSVFDKLFHQKDEYDKESLTMLGSFIKQLDRRSGKGVARRRI